MKRPAGKVSSAGSITTKRPAGRVGKTGAKKKDAKPVKPKAKTHSKPVNPKKKPAAAVTPEPLVAPGHPVVTTALPEDILRIPVQYGERSELIRFSWFYSSVSAHFCDSVLHMFTAAS